MSKIRSSRTQFEKDFVAKIRKKTRKSFRTNAEDLKGKPDIVFQKEKVCVFLDSDFWHGWQYPRWKRILKNNFWKRKIENTRNRDVKTTAYLRRKGWKVLRIWGHQINEQFDAPLNKVIDSLRKDGC
jgi:DNA mismatch endonuclease (patch repair protein)